jgi:hypothetical protein
MHKNGLANIKIINEFLVSAYRLKHPKEMRYHRFFPELLAVSAC